MGDLMLDGVLITPLKRVSHPKGDIFHALKKSELGFSSFGEAYFSAISQLEIKGWKKHTKMILNIIVPIGTIKFYLIDDRPESLTRGKRQYFIISPENYSRLTVPAGIWMAFEGIGEHNLLLNIASIEHDPQESENRPLEAFSFLRFK